MLAWGDRRGNISIASTNGVLLARLPRDHMTWSYSWHPKSRMIAFAMSDGTANSEIFLARRLVPRQSCLRTIRSFTSVCAAYA